MDWDSRVEIPVKHSVYQDLFARFLQKGTFNVWNQLRRGEPSSYVKYMLGQALMSLQVNSNCSEVLGSSEVSVFNKLWMKRSRRKGKTGLERVSSHLLVAWCHSQWFFNLFKLPRRGLKVAWLQEIRVNYFGLHGCLPHLCQYVVINLNFLPCPYTLQLWETA